MLTINEIHKGENVGNGLMQKPTNGHRKGKLSKHISFSVQAK